MVFCLSACATLGHLPSGHDEDAALMTAKAIGEAEELKIADTAKDILKIVGGPSFIYDDVLLTGYTGGLFEPASDIDIFYKNALVFQVAVNAIYPDEIKVFRSGPWVKKLDQVRKAACKFRLEKAKSRFGQLE